jgi:hypothetical protein
MVDEQALVDGLKPGHLAAAGLASFGSQAGSHEHVGMRLAADIVTAKVLLEGWVRTSTGRPGRHGMQEVREFDSPRLHQPTNLRGAVNTGSSDFRGQPRQPGSPGVGRGSRPHRSAILDATASGQRASGEEAEQFGAIVLAE